MASLQVMQAGQEIENIELSQETEYFIGRGQDCDFVVENSAGVSRKHFKVFFDGNDWQVELLARFGSLGHGNDGNQKNLEDGKGFSINDYEFIFVNPPEASEEAGFAEDQGFGGEDGFEAPADQGFDAPSSDNLPVSVDGDTNAGVENNTFEKTRVGKLDGSPYIKISSAANPNEEVLRLEGNIWTGGRDKNCEIHVNEKGASRRHFELAQTMDGFFITDLNSSNGTLINGKKILSDQPVPIKSGDIITVLSTNIFFEVRDPNFREKMELIPASMLEPIENNLPAPTDIQWPAELAPMPQQQQRVVVRQSLDQFSETNEKKSFLKKHKIKVAIVLVLIIAGLMAMEEPKGKKEQASKAPGVDQSGLENLTAEQVTFVKDTYNLANNLHTQRKFDLALIEFQRIHEIVPFYKKSRQLEAECVNHKRIRQEQEEIAAQKEKKRAMEQRVAAIVIDCESKMTETTTMAQLEQCLGEALDLDPDNQAIQNMRLTIEERLANKERKAQERAAYAKLVARGKRLYDKAYAVEQSGRLYEAIGSYKAFLAAKMPDPKKLRPKAERSIASIRASIGQKTGAIIQQAKSQFDQTNYSEAMKTLRSGLTIDPTNSEIKSKIQEYSGQITRQMKPIYQDAVLEESMGHIESAKDKWRKIKTLAPPDDPYYKKSRIKLKKYGG